MADEVVYSWCELHAKLLEDLESGSIGAVQSYSVATAGGSRSFSYKSTDDLLKLIRHAADMCALQCGELPYIGRTCGATRSR